MDIPDNVIPTNQHCVLADGPEPTSVSLKKTPEPPHSNALVEENGGHTRY